MLKPFATKLPEETLNRLDELSRKTRVPKSRLLEQALGLLAAHYRQLDQDQLVGKKVREAERLQPA